MTKHIIICSHGFGVKRDDRGLFPDIVSEVPEAEVVMFDYNEVQSGGKEVKAAPFTEQVLKLTEVIRRAREENPDAVIDLVSHSQGSIAVGLLNASDVEEIRKIVMTAPPETLSGTRVINRFKDHPATLIDMAGTSRLGREDGTVTLVGERFWQELEMLKPVELYNFLAKLTDVTFIKADQDEVFGKVGFKGLVPDIKIMGVEADHQFTGESREKLKRLIEDLII